MYVDELTSDIDLGVHQLKTHCQFSDHFNSIEALKNPLLAIGQRELSD